MTEPTGPIESTEVDPAELSRRELDRLIRDLRGEGGSAAADDRPRIPRRAARAAPARLSFAQERLWFLERMDPGSARYNVPGALRLTGALRPARLARALGGIVRRHEVLRSRFEAAAEGAVQRILPPGPAPLPLVDLSALPEAAADGALDGVGASAARRPFDLAAGPPLFALLARRRAGRERGEHVLFVTLHHIVADGWSIGLLLRELAALYARDPGRLPALPVQYADFAVWQRSQLAGARLEAEVAYWRERLAGIAPLELPADRPRPAAPSGRGRALPVALAAGTGAAVRALAASADTTPYAVLVAAFEALVLRYTGQRDFAIGMPVAGRRAAEVEPLIGCFVNTLVLRSDLGPPPEDGGEVSFRGLLGRVRATLLDALDHQDVPFERLVEALAPGRDAGSTPFFQVVLGLQPALGGAGPPALPGLGAELVALSTGTAKFDLTLDLRQSGPRGERFEGTLEHALDRFDGASVERLWRHFARLLDAASRAPETPLDRLPLIDEAERRELLALGGRPGELPPARSLPELFAVVAARSPDAVALAEGAETLTYGELDRRSRTLAGRIRRRLERAAGRPGGGEHPVGLLLERSLDGVVATLAVLRAGAYYVPLDPAYPEARLRGMLGELEALSGGRALLVTRGRELSRFPETGAETIRLDEPERPGPDRGGAEAAVSPDALCYAMYTSGSTGRPKGVAIPHAGVDRLVREADYGAFGPDDTFFQLAPTAFDAATFEIWGALLTGARLEVMPAGPLDLADLGRTIRERRVTVLFLTAGLFHRVVEERVGDLAAARHVLSGGDVVSPAHARRVLEAAPGARVTNGYGPTESTTFTTCHEVDRHADPALPLPIGRPVAARRVVIVDPALRPAPRGAVGELCVAGEGLARGYLGRPGRTAQVFVPHPEPSAPGERLYRTGDLARWRGDGTVEFLGRRDQQVKIRGFRVEPGEVEAALAALPGVARAAVTVHDRGTPAARMIGWAVLEDGDRPATGAAAGGAALRQALRSLLPAAMVPSAVALLEELPLGPTGKVDRKALAALAGTIEPAAPEAEEAPRTATERAVAAAFEAVLGAAGVGAHDDFFDVGGHSLAATRLVWRLREELGVELPVRALFEAPTVAGIAAAVAAARAGAMGEGEDDSPPLVLRTGPGPAPLSFAQERLWFLDRLEPGSARYNVPAGLRLSGTLRPAALAGALSAAAARHEVLRTRFDEVDDRPVQRVEPPAPVPLPVVDLSILPEAVREAETARVAGAEGRRPFDLAAGPLLRAFLLRLEAGEHVLVIDLHHIVADGWSIGVLARELEALYGAAGAAGAPARPTLPALPIQYADFARWQRRWLTGERLDGELGYWRERLAGLPPLELPADRPRPARPSGRGATFEVELPGATAARVRALAASLAATPYAVLVAAFETLAMRYSGQRDFGLGAPVAGRRRSETGPLVGFFVNTLVLRSDLMTGSGAGEGPSTFAGLVGRVRATLLDALAHQDVPFERLVEELAPQRDTTRNPLFQVAFGYQPTALSLDLPGIVTRPVTIDSGTAKFDLAINLRPDGGDDGPIVGTVEHATDLFDTTTARRLWHHYARLLAAAVEAPRRALDDLPLMAPAERAQVLIEWAGAESGYPRDASVPELFAEVAAACPDRVALVDGGAALSYGELARRARRLAAELRRRGVGPETPVALLLERSAAQVVATLAVLFAGAYYAPIEPSYPAQRVARMLREAEAPLVLTTGETGRALPESGAGWSAEVLRLEEIGPAAARPEAEPDGPPAPHAESLAYVMYTSGSTGRPKGVGVPHRGVTRLVREPDFVRLGADETFLELAPTAFDAATLEIWGPLLNGGRLEVMARGPLDLERLGRTLRERRVGTLWLTAGLFHRMVEERPEDLDGVGQLLAGGDVLSPPHVRRLLDRPGRAAGARLINGYGPTENATFTACHAIDPARDARGGAGPVPIGRPIADGRVVLLDPELRPVPVGVPGELCAAGDGLARGYLGWPSRTAASFVPHPLPRVPGERIYRTGDLARWRPDGTLDFLGRRDRQVKIRGFRIEPGEVETALVSLPGVAQAGVVVHGRGTDAARLVGYVAFEPGRGRAPAELRAELAARLPEAMLPSAIAALDALPLDPNGKVDRGALARLDPGSPAPAGERTAPRTATEARVAAAYAEALELPAKGAVGVAVGVEDDFFALGGHSLLAYRVVSRLRRETGVDLPLRELFDRRTVEGVAAALDAAAGPHPAPEPADGERSAFGPTAPLSFAQERLWILDRIDPGGAAYGIPLAVRLAGPLDHRALDRAIAGVAARHETLRTTFATEAGRPVQVVHPAGRSPLVRVDLRGLPPERRRTEADRLTAAAAAKTFDLAHGPLFRTFLAILGDELAVLQVTMHHIVSDGWSLGVFVRETAALYRGESLPPLPVRYGEFAARQRRWLAGEVREAQLAYWRRALAGAPPGLELPLDRPRPAVRGYRGDRRERRLPGALADALRAFAQAEGATLFMVLLAGFAVVLQRLAGEDDVVVGAPVAGRDRGDVEGLIGMFLNTLVLRTDLSGAPSFREAVARVRGAALGAFAHQEVPFEMLIDTLRPERDLSRTPFFQVFFNMFEERLEAAIDFAGVEAEVLRLPELPSKFDLTLYLQPAEAGLDLAAVFNADLFDGATIERVLDQYRALLERAVAEPERPVGELPLLLERDRAALPDPGRPLDSTWRGSVPEALARAARETPDRIAVSGPDGSYSYRALDAWSAAIAARLAAAGVRRGDRVAIHAQRRPSLAAAVHGVLRAGGAFVNLDPAYPAERIADTIEAAGARVLLRLAGAGALDDDLATWLGALGVTVLDLEPRPWAGGEAGFEAIDLGPWDVAYVAFTSGSTGRPKGIVGRHGSLTHFLPWQRARFGLGPDDRFTLLSGLAHDPLQRDLFTPVWLGAALVVPEVAVMAVPERLRAWLAAERATVAVLTPAMGQVLTERMDDRVGRGAPAVALRRVFLVGDALTRRDARRLRRLAPGVSVVNMYGSTETQRAVGFHETTCDGSAGAEREGREVLPLGRGMKGAELLVLAPGGGLAGVGEVGEIAVRSPHLSGGYLGDPALTAERFVPAPGDPAGGRMYRTGDLGRFDAAGEVRFLGRADQQVKVRGFRIELGEVTARVTAVPGVREAAVLLRTDGARGARLAAYVVPEDGAALAAADVREPLRRALPGYMVPASYVFLDALPLTPNRKLDRRALLALDDRPQEATVSRDAPITEAERKIAAVVQEVLGLERVGPEENFFDLGGNSLLLIQVHGRLQEVFGREIPMVELFSHTTVRSLAGHLSEMGIDAERGDGAARPFAGAKRADRSDTLREGRDRLNRRRRRAG